MSLGDLVVSSTQFSGVGKIINYENNKYDISFFHSPLSPHANTLQVSVEHLKKYKLYSEQVVYVREENTGLWQRARYIGGHGESNHLVVFREDEKLVCELSEIFILNTQQDWVDPIAFLKMHANDSPFFFPFREKFIEAYIHQRAACCSIGAILSSAIELESHQLAVVKRVLQDPVKKYLLADEVGLGKTIESGILIREHVLSFKKRAQVLVIVPDALESQWIHELKFRFHLEDVMASEFNDLPNVDVVGYQAFCNTISKKMSPKTMIVVDEMHQLATWAWGDNLAQTLTYYRLVSACEQADTVLLLSGTPLNGNEKNFLAMLHCLSPHSYKLDEEGIQAFKKKIELVEVLGGMRGALVHDNENTVIENILDELSTKFSEDGQLLDLIDKVRPLVDFFDGVDQQDQTRKQKIETLNHYIGEHYRLHERMLRNRRDSKGLDVLFPGLAGAQHCAWTIPDESLSLEYFILEYLSIYHPADESAYFTWLNDFMISPQRIAQRCTDLAKLVTDQDQQILLGEITAQAALEQQAKDRVLIDLVAQGLQQSSKLKMVVFVEDTDLSHEVYTLLQNVYPQQVEHNLAVTSLAFNDESADIRVLVCDHTGEDGLNLQGVERLVIHYAMTPSISRIEQRLGRVNRYCANIKGVKAIQSWVLLPEYEGIFRGWVSVLDHSVGIFNRTMASLQYVLEEQFTNAWKKSLVIGVPAFDELKLRLGCFGNSIQEESLIELEFKKVRAQEELMALDSDVQRAVSFAQAISRSDDQAELDVARMLDWIIQVLKFKQQKEGPHQFRLGYQNGAKVHEARTLLDIASFIQHCFLGVDSENPPWTHVMSPSRRFLSSDQGHVYPLRYGQPFVDSIFNLLKQDARGATSAILRVFKKIKLSEPEIFFKLTWVINHNGPNVVLADELFAPRVESMWLDHKGSMITASNRFYPLLNIAYKDQCLENVCEEISIRPKVWSVIKNQIDLGDWSSWIDHTVLQSKTILMDQFQGDLKFTLVNMHTQIYLSH